VTHTSPIESLGFIGPSEIDPGSGIPDAVVGLLNEATNGPDFHWTKEISGFCPWRHKVPERLPTV